MSTYKTYTIENICHIVEIGTKLYPFWFRGHSQCFEHDPLVPKIFRGGEFVKNVFSGDELEFEYMQEYQRKVLMFADKVPGNRDFISWLFLMQHYGMPTRLLDWTENVLVAAYFTVCANQNEDGEIWAIFPQRLNKLYCGECFPLWHTASINYLAGQPFHKAPIKLAEELGLKKVPDTPIAFYPPLNNHRMVAQSSVFTIHPPTKQDGSNTIVGLLSNSEKLELVRYVIPTGCKGEIYRNLNKLGMNRVRLFPEQDSVAFDIRCHWQPKWGYPKKAPECGGEYKIKKVSR
jgi:hypothetical protein